MLARVSIILCFEGETTVLKYRFMWVWVFLGAALAAAAAQAQSSQAPISLKLLVPASAQVELDGTKMKATGTSREYLSPPVPVGPQYQYTLKVTADGKTVTRDIPVRPGVENSVNLRSAFGTGERLAAYAPMEQPGGSAADDKQVIHSKATHRTPATSVNFRKQLGLTYPTLTTLGARIDAARRAPDPVALAHTASELAVAEKVSGKQADVTSSTVLKEAAELAKLRRQATELQAVSAVAQQIATEQTSIADLKKEIALSNSIAQSYPKAADQNAEPTWAARTIVVNNYTTQYLTIYVNGIYKGEMGPGLQQSYTIEHRWNPVVLTANGDQDIDSWGPVNVWGKFSTYTWNIN